MTTPYLFSPPPKYYLPLSLGGDLAVDFQNNPSGDGTTFVSYAPGVAVTLILDVPSAPVTAVATISGSNANIKVESAVTDTVPSGTPWRVIASFPTTPTTEVVGAYGTVKRFDG